MQDGDIIVLQTKQFSDIISIGTLTEFMDSLSPAEAAENLAPLVHEKEEAGAAAIIVNYKMPVEEEVAGSLEDLEEQESKEEAVRTETDQSPFYAPVSQKK